MATIEVEGNKYKVTENLGYQGGYYAKAVTTPRRLIRRTVRRLPSSAVASGHGGWRVIVLVGAATWSVCRTPPLKRSVKAVRGLY